MTASHAIFKRDNISGEAPVAVVGFQFYHTALHALFVNITSTCDKCIRDCNSAELFCLVLDDNGYVVVSYDRKYTGMFFGDIRPDIMNQLVREGIYEPIRMYDYQATCFQPRETGNWASTLSKVTIVK